MNLSEAVALAAQLMCVCLFSIVFSLGRVYSLLFCYVYVVFILLVYFFLLICFGISCIFWCSFLFFSSILVSLGRVCQSILQCSIIYIYIDAVTLVQVLGLRCRFHLSRNILSIFDCGIIFSYTHQDLYKIYIIIHWLKRVWLILLLSYSLFVIH